MMRLVRIVGIILAIVVVIAVALPFFVDANQFRPRLETTLSGALGRDTKLGDLKLSIWSGAVTASNLSISDDPKFAKNPFLTAKSVAVGVDLMDLIFSKKLIVTGIQIERPEISLIQADSGAWNFSSLGATGGNAPTSTKQQAPAAGPSAAPNLSVKLLKIVDGRISLQRGGGPKPQVLEKVNVEVKDFAASASFPFSFTAAVEGGGQIALAGNAGPIDMGDAAATPFKATLKVDKLDLIRTGFVSPATGLAGIVSVNGTLNSAGNKYDLTGDVRAEQLKLAKNGTPAKIPVEFHFTLGHNAATRAGSLTRGDVLVGKAKASLTGTYSLQEKATLLDMKLVAPAMEVQELTGMLPPLAVELPRGSSLQGGTLTANFAITGPADKLDMKGTLAVKGTRLANFDLGSKMTSVAKLAGIKMGPNTDFENISANAHSSAQGIDLQNISIIATDIGEISGAGTISPANMLDFKMRAKLKASGAFSALASNVPFTIEGPATDPKFSPDVKAMTSEKLKAVTGAPTEAGKAAGGVLNMFKKKSN